MEITEKKMGTSIMGYIGICASGFFDNIAWYEIVSTIAPEEDQDSQLHILTPSIRILHCADYAVACLQEAVRNCWFLEKLVLLTVNGGTCRGFLN